MSIRILFSQYFDIPAKTLDDYGTIDLCLSSDLPLFIDPFLLFASGKSEYLDLHKKITSHLMLLKKIAQAEDSPDLNIFKFPEQKQNWFGLCRYGNGGKGLGPKFAANIISEFNGFYKDFGESDITQEIHIEKLTLFSSGIGKDFISDFTTNLMLEYLLEYTQKFAKEYLDPDQVKNFSIRCSFDENLQIWQPKTFTLPYFFREQNGDYIILTPLDILTKDDAFICHSDLVSSFTRVVPSIGNLSLRDKVNRYYRDLLPAYNPKKADKLKAIELSIKNFPFLLDEYIKLKEQDKDSSKSLSLSKVAEIKRQVIEPLILLSNILLDDQSFYSIQPKTYSEALQRVYFLKDVIENNDGYRVFYNKGFATATEETIQRIFRLTWFHTPWDVNSEVNNGRGPADYKISYGGDDSTIVEFKLAKSSSLKKNLLNQVEIYKKASKSISDIKVILCYNKTEINKANRILRELKLENAENIIIIDASPKTSASKV